jgi:hypothetical protein
MRVARFLGSDHEDAPSVDPHSTSGSSMRHYALDEGMRRSGRAKSEGERSAGRQKVLISDAEALLKRDEAKRHGEKAGAAMRSQEGDAQHGRMLGMREKKGLDAVAVTGRGQTMVELCNMGRFRCESVGQAACEGDRSPCATRRERC